MDVLYFLKDRTRIIRQYYEHMPRRTGNATRSRSF